MTPEEQVQLEERLKVAAAARKRIEILTNGLRAVNTGGASRINVLLDPMAKDTPLLSSDDTKVSCGWATVCWSNSEAGIVEEFREAVITILSRRLAEANQELERA